MFPSPRWVFMHPIYCEEGWWRGIPSEPSEILFVMSWIKKIYLLVTTISLFSILILYFCIFFSSSSLFKVLFLDYKSNIFCAKMHKSQPNKKKNIFPNDSTTTQHFPTFVHIQAHTYIHRDMNTYVYILHRVESYNMYCFLTWFYLIHCVIATVHLVTQQLG